MGNASTRYMTNVEAITVLGGIEQWNELKLHLEKIAGKFIDYRIFCEIIGRTYERIPKVLCECLFRAFAADTSRRVDIEAFLSSYAVLVSNNQVLKCRFLFRIYENEFSSSGIQRKSVEDILRLAYGDRMKAHINSVQHFMEILFKNSPTQELTLKEFENCNIKLDILASWVQKVLKCFIKHGTQYYRLYALERKYSTQLETKEIMYKYKLSRSICDNLRRRFHLLCDQPMNNIVTSTSSFHVMNLNIRAELQLTAWLYTVLGTKNHSHTTAPHPTITATIPSTTTAKMNNICIPYLTETLATVIFQSHIDVFKPKWRFIDFATFCAVFGGHNRQLQVETVVDAFIQSALSEFYSEERQLVITKSNDCIINTISMKHTNDNSSINSSSKDLPPPVQIPKNSFELTSERTNFNEENIDVYVLNTLNNMVNMLTYSPMNEHNINNQNHRTLLLTALNSLNNTVESESLSVSFSSFLMTHYALLPGLRDLSLTACCRFGFHPPSPLNEMEFITELTLRYLQLCPQSTTHPYGPVGTEWCVVPKGWYDSWRLYVGQQRTAPSAMGSDMVPVVGTAGTVRSPPPTPTTTGSNGSGKLGGANAASGSMKRSAPPPRPSAIDTTVLLRRPSIAASSGMSLSLSSILSSSTLSAPKVISKHGQLLPGLVCGRDIEVVAPAVYDALIAWYGGGPPIVRKVVTSTIPKRPDATHIRDTRLSVSPRLTGGGSELELYPLSVNIYTCDNGGNMNPQPLCEGLLFSKTNTVQDVVDYLCATHTVEVSRVRLWNYSHPGRDHWKEQYILSPELTLLRANIQDGQAILMEVSLVDGSWPRSLLHAYLDSEERIQQGVTEEEESSAEGILHGGVETSVGIETEESSAGKEVEDSQVYFDEYTGTTGVRTAVKMPIGSKVEESTVMNAAIAVQSTLDQTGVTALTAAVGSVLGAPLPSGSSPSHRRNRMRAPSLGPSYNVPIPAHKRNSGLVGMDNLGNTCYMNSSLQALLHTEPLAEYFLSKSYLRHLNLHSMHGFKGKLAHSFGRLAQELWCTTEGCITPRYFKYDIAHLHEQFSGNEQHDAHELLAFLLDGLSEDLNLVYEKPYTEQPDSDGRRDAVVADIWWANHLKRDRSVIQALFSGQFKSVMTCSHPGCGYTSARFEPFNFLSVPVPEETERLTGVTVVPLQSQYTVYCEVRVPKNGVLQDIVNAILQLGLEGLVDSQPGDYKSTTTATNNHIEPSSLTAERINNTEPHEIWPAEIYFQAGELINNRIKSFNSMERRVDTIRENECLVFYQVRRLAGDIIDTSNSVDSSSGNINSSAQEVEEETEVPQPFSLKLKEDYDTTTAKAKDNEVPILAQHASASSIKDQKFDQGFMVNTLYLPNYNQSDRYVRVAFTQRRVRLRDANREYTSAELPTTVNGNGNASSTEYFQLEPFGLSTLEVVPNKMRCGDLYRLMARRYAAFLKAPVRSLIRHRQQQRLKLQQQLRHCSSAGSLHSMNDSSTGTGGGGVYDSSSLCLNTDTFASNTVATVSALPPEDFPVNVRLEQIHTAETDEVVGGAIPKEGFTLRLVSGGAAGNSTACSRCPWLHHCEGCVLPDSNEVSVELRDGESLAVDWHFVVFEDLLDTAAICTVKRHYTDTQQQQAGGSSSNTPSTTSTSSSSNEKYNNSNYISTPLQRCLDKFTESERLDDVVCPRCRQSNGNMQKSFTLWRLPPVLIIQLKRFQFDRTNRRKLNNHIDFPLENLDVFDYLATSRQKSLCAEGIERVTATTTNVDTAVNIDSTTVATTATATGSKGMESSSSSAALAMSALYGDSGSSSPTQPAMEIVTETKSTEHIQSKSLHSIATTTTSSTAGTTTTSTTGSSELCTKYDLYSVIHHAGAMGGGHYATTARSLNINTAGNNTPLVSATSADTDTWYCYNDNIVNKVADTRDICSSSAYVLFYMRQDMRQGDVLSLLRSQLSVPTGIYTAGNIEETEEQIQDNTSNTAAGTVPVVPHKLQEEGKDVNMHLMSTHDDTAVSINKNKSAERTAGQVGDGVGQHRVFSGGTKIPAGNQQTLSCPEQKNNTNGDCSNSISNTSATNPDLPQTTDSGCVPS